MALIKILTCIFRLHLPHAGSCPGYYEYRLYSKHLLLRRTVKTHLVKASKYDKKGKFSQNSVSLNQENLLLCWSHLLSASYGGQNPAYGRPITDVNT